MSHIKVNTQEIYSPDKYGGQEKRIELLLVSLKL